MCYSGCCQFEDSDGECRKPRNAKCPDSCAEGEKPFDAWEDAMIERAEREIEIRLCGEA